jgi:hypothetical protein
MDFHDRIAFRAHMARTGGKFAGHEHGGTCHVCGATAFYVARFYHAATNAYIVVGEDCAAKLAMGHPAAFKAFRERAREGVIAHAGKAKAKAALEAAGHGAAWPVYVAGGGKYEETTIADIVGRLVKYGSVSDKQMNYIGVLLGKIADRAGIEAQRAVEHEAAAPLPPAGRMEIEGVVLAVKEPAADAMFPQYKMLVKADAGWKVWGSRPAALIDVVRGDRVRFVARVEPSKDDPKFGFYSRPSNAHRIDNSIKVLD